MKLQDVIELPKVGKRVKNGRTRSSSQALIQTQLNLYTGASFNNLPDGGSQGGHIIFLTDFHNKFCPLI